MRPMNRSVPDGRPPDGAPIDRRSFLRAGGALSLGVALGGCGPLVAAGRTAPARPGPFPPIRVGWDRIIRTTVGLRPHRPSGFLLRPERFDGKTVIHNFGHGGAGMSLSWGTAHLAADHAIEHPDRRVAVIGCGIVGLTAARVLQRRGFDVTIYAKDLPPRTTSNMSWAGFTPTSGLVSRRTPEWDAQFRAAVAIAYREHQLLAGRDYGVSWIYSFSRIRSEPADEPDPGLNPGEGETAPGADGERYASDPLLSDDFEMAGDLVGPGEHPFPDGTARRRLMLRFEPSIYLEALMRDVLLFGGRIVVREFPTVERLLEVPERLIVNSTGLGSKRLFGDPELIPVKGQLVVLAPQPEIDYAVGAIMPRGDGIVLGHVQRRGDWSLEVDDEERARVVESAIRTLAPGPATRTPDAAAANDRWSPTPAVAGATSAPPVESFFGLLS